MKLQEVFDQLSGSEFSQLSIGGQEAGVINENNYARVMGYINLGLTALYTRFNLKQRRLLIPLQADADTYQLNVDDILKIEQVLTDSGFEMPLNQEGNEISCFTPTLKSLRVPKIILTPSNMLDEQLKTDGLLVVYRANHPKLVLQTWSIAPGNKELELPTSHLEALLFFVASRVHNPVGMSNEFHAGNSYFAKYEAECQRLKSLGLEPDQDRVESRARRNGWA